MIDEGNDLLGRTNAEAQAWSDVFDRPLQELAGALGASARETAGGGSDLENLDARLQRIYGRATEAPPGLGLQLHALRGLVVSALDLDETEAVAEAAERRFTGAAGLKELLAWPSWIKEHNRGLALLSAATFGVAKLGNDSSPLEHLDQALNVVSKCREALIPHFIASIAAQDGPDYDRRRRKTSGSLISDGSRDYPDLHFEEHLDKRLRHAGAHVDYDVHDGQVLIRSDQGHAREIPVDEVVDAVLSHIEIVVALYLGLVCAASTRGLDLPASAHASPRDLAAGLELVVGFVTGTQARVQLDESVIQLAYTGDPRTFISIAAAATELLPERIAWIEAEVTSANVLTRCAAPLSAFRDHDTVNSNTIEGLLNYAAICAAVRIGGDAWLPAEDWSGLAARVLELAGEAPLRERVKLVRRFLTHAGAAGAEDAERLCVAWIRQLRQPTQ